MTFSKLDDLIKPWFVCLLFVNLRMCVCIEENLSRIPYIIRILCVSPIELELNSECYLNEMVQNAHLNLHITVCGQCKG